MPVLSSYPTRVLTRLVGLDSSDRVGLSSVGIIPLVNVMDFGAVGDGSTNDTAAVQAAIDSADGSGKSVVFPSGNYYVPSGVTVNGNGTKLIGFHGTHSAPGLFCGAANDVATVTLNGFASGIEGLSINGPGLELGSPAVFISGDAVEATVGFCRVEGGAQCIKTYAVDTHIYDLHIEGAYGNALVLYAQGANGWITRGKFDHQWAVSAPSSPLANWATLTAYSAGAIVTVTTGGGTYVLQCATPGTSGAFEPDAANYGVDIVDGTVHWLLACNRELNALKCDNSGGVQAINCDMTGAVSNGILLSDDGSAGHPENCYFLNCTVGQAIDTSISILVGQGIIIDGCQLTNAINGGSGIYVGGGNGDIILTNNQIFGGFENGIFIDNNAANVVIMTNNMIADCSVAAISIGTNIEKFIIANNNLGESSTWGTNANAVIIGAGCNYYNIVNNIFHGAAAGLTDGGGATKTVSGNV